MNLTNLTYFIAAAEELNFTRAARRLYISQQALSSHIAKLEEYYQVPLFDRGNPMTLTDAGRVLYQSAVQITETLELCDRRLQDIKDFTRGSLSVGIPVTRGTMMLPQLCSAFHQLYPKVHLEIFEGQTTPEVEQALAAGKIDLAVGYVPQDATNIVSVPLYRETYVLVAPNQLLAEMFPPHTLVAMKRKPQSIAAFAGLPFVGQIETTMGGKVFRQLCREADVTPHVVLTTANILTLLNLCVAGLGVCTLPSTFVRQSDALPGLRGAGIVGPETLRRVTVFELNSATGCAAKCSPRPGGSLSIWPRSCSTTEAFSLRFHRKFFLNQKRAEGRCAAQRPSAFCVDPGLTVTDPCPAPPIPWFFSHRRAFLRSGGSE